MISADDPEVIEIRRFTAEGLAIEAYNPEALTPNVYSFRAECPYDVAVFIKELFDRKINFKIKHSRLGTPEQMGDPTGELYTDVDIDTLRAVLDSKEDVHVLRQTLRPIPLADNNLERDWYN